MKHARTLTSSLAIAAAIGVAAAPVALDSDLAPVPNAASAQASGSDDSNSNDTSGDLGAQDADDSGADDVIESGSDSNPGVAEERASTEAAAIPDETADSVYVILGTTQEDAEAADTRTSASAQYGPLEGYQTEVERGNLDAAAETLSVIAEEPITEEMVTEVNTELGVETTLTPQQIAETAAQKQDSTN